MVTREQIVAKAREYLGTPFLHQARVKGMGLDCVGLVLCVSEELGLKDRAGVPFHRFDRVDYSAQPTDGEVHDTCKERLIQKPLYDLKPGDVVTMKIPTEPCHVGIITSVSKPFGSYVIHAYSGGSQRVVEHVVDRKWYSRFVGAFSFPGID